MIKADMSSSAFQSVVARVFRALPLNAQLYVLSRISDRYPVSTDTLVGSRKEEIVVGYESGWPQTYKKPH